jgi:hypothetical protein
VWRVVVDWVAGMGLGYVLWFYPDYVSHVGYQVLPIPTIVANTINTITNAFIILTTRMIL